jgi:hypothetical protein
MIRRCDAKAARQSIQALQSRQIIILGVTNAGFLADAMRSLSSADG